MELPFAVTDPQPPLLQPNNHPNATQGQPSVATSGIPQPQHVQPPHHQQQHHHQQLNYSQHTQTLSNSQSQQQGGGLLYNNLIPGHYRYASRPPAPPPGPLSAMQSAIHPQPQLSLQYGIPQPINNFHMAQGQHTSSYQTPSGQAAGQMSQQNHFQQHNQMQQQQRQQNNAPQHMYQQAQPISTQQTPQYQQSSQQSIEPVQQEDYYLQVEEPEDDDDLLVIAPPDVEEDDDDEKYYRPFRHANNASSLSKSFEQRNGSSSVNSAGTGSGRSSGTLNGSRNGQSQQNKCPDKDSTNDANTRSNSQLQEESKPAIDLLTILLSGPVAHDNQEGESNETKDQDRITLLMEDAAEKSREARSMTEALAAKRHQIDNDTKNSTNPRKLSDASATSAAEADNEHYIATANAHTEAAKSFQKVYRVLLGMDEKGKAQVGTLLTFDQKQKVGGTNGTLSPGGELAKSMLILANGHARMAASLGTMGVKWNMGQMESDGQMVPKGFMSSGASGGNSGDGRGVNANGGNKSISTKEANTKGNPGQSSTSTSAAQGVIQPQHERLQMAVRGALDPANHEEDITNSTFLNRSTVLNATKKASVKPNKVAGGNVTKKSGGDRAVGSGAGGGVNPVDDLMKLEKELRGMDMALEMGNSVSALGAAVSSRPDGSFCVVPPGSSYMSSSSMWTSGILGVAGGGSAQQQQQQQQPDRHHKPPKGAVGVRSRANHVQNFLGGNHANAHIGQRVGTGTNTASSAANQESATTTSSAAQHTSPPKEDHSTVNAALEASWWGGGQGSMMSSVLASSAINTAAASNQRPTQTNGSNQSSNSSVRRDSANTKQLMQLMDSLNRLGNENAQLMREVEEAKVARAEAKAAKEMMAKFKSEYGQRFMKVKEALEKYPKQYGDGNAENPVTNSAYMKSASMMEMQKRDQMIKKLAADLKKEREESKKKDTALRKYEGFYREVKARSAEKARQRQLQEEQKKLQLQKQQQNQQQQQQQQQQQRAV